MAATDLAGVIVLAKKAWKAQTKGHCARAAECFGAAAEAACALHLPDDCLVLAYLKAFHADNLFSHSTSAGVTPADALLLSQKALSILDAVVPVLRSRKAAGTLMGAGRSATEQAFALAQAEICSKLTGSDVPALAALMFYETYLVAGIYMLESQLAVAKMLGTEQEMPHGSELVAGRYDFLASALDFIAEPRVYSDRCLGPEASLFGLVRSIAGYDGAHQAFPNLLAAWERLLRSGVVKKRKLEAARGFVRRDMAKIGNAADATAAQHGLHECSLAGCAAREVHAWQFKRCAACKLAQYCCKEHQVADWPAHKAACKAARKAAAAASGE